MNNEVELEVWKSPKTKLFEREIMLMYIDILYLMTVLWIYAMQQLYMLRIELEK